jgi:hypothetical protein|tara:strand:- start:206 stop:400 length:195 start_codon:yes stop_codon:yes gene_type:complete
MIFQAQSNVLLCAGEWAIKLSFYRGFLNRISLDKLTPASSLWSPTVGIYQRQRPVTAWTLLPAG